MGEMKVIIISILLFFTAQAQTAWYVNTQDTDAPWSGTASNPWKWFDNNGYDNWEGGIDWSSISAGDTIYIDGGADSTVIRPNNGEGYLIQDAVITGGQVVITKDWRTGHNGDVYFMNSHLTVQYGAYSGSPVQANVNIQNSVGLKFVGLNFIVNEPQGDVITDAQSTCLVLENDSLITFEDCWVNTNGVAGAIGMDTPAKMTFDNCLIESEYNTYTNDNDIFTWSQAGYGEHLIKDCEIINRDAYIGFTIGGTNVTTDSTASYFSVTVSDGNYTHNYHRYAALVMGSAVMIVDSNNTNTFYGGVWTDGDDPPDTLNMPADGIGFTVASLAHRDVMQMGYGNNPSRPVTKFINNFIWVLYSQDVNSWNQCHYLGDDASHISIQDFVYIGNTFVIPIDTNGNGVAIIAQNWPNASSLSKWEFYNNTFIASGGWFGNTQVMDSCVAYNNVFVVLNPNSTITLGRSDLVSVDSIDYNYWSVPNWNTRTWLNDATFLWDNYVYYTWATWQSAGNDVNSSRDVDGTFEFQDIQDSVLTAYIPPATLRDAGKDLSYLFGEYPELQYDALGNERGYNSTWDIGALEYTGAVVDSTPSNVTFISSDISNAELNTQYTNSMTDLTGFDSGYVHINRGWYNIDGGAFKSTEWTMVYPNDDVTVFDTTGSEYSTTQSIILTIGNDADTFIVRTKDAPSNTNRIVKLSNGKILKDKNYKIVRAGGTTSTLPAEPDTTAPLAPTSFVAIGGTDTASFSCTWTNPSASDLDSIRIYEGSSNDTTTMTWIATVLAPNTSYLRTGRATNTTYWCAVKAVDDSGNVSYFSNVDSATTSSSASGTPLANLDLAYLTNSFAAHLYDHSLYGSAGTTDMQEEMTAYNTANSSDGSITRISPDYPDCGDMIWHWNQVFFGGSLYSNTQNVIDEYASGSYDILQVTFGFNSGDIWFPGWYVDETDTLNYPLSHIENVYKYWIRNMVSAMENYPDKYWILWNIPPVTVGSSGGSADAQRHANFNTWMVDTLQAGLDSYGAFPSNVYVFDVYTLLKDPSSNFMNPDYADGSEDSHPNEDGQDVVAPVYIQEVFDKARAYRIP